MFVPVVDNNQNPLMPTKRNRAWRWIRSGRATPFRKKGMLCVRLNEDPSGTEVQAIAVGVDPGSKREGFSVKSEAHTFLNVQAEAVSHVKEAVEVRRNMRRGRRYRHGPCRKNRQNRAKGGIPPSTFARWNWKLRVCKWLCKIFPVTIFVVEDIKAESRKGCRTWNHSFNPLQVGKKWFYDRLGEMGNLCLKSSFETYEMRVALGLKKSKNKMAEVFEAHCVDAWVLAHWAVGGDLVPENKAMLCLKSLRLHRRQLHAFQFAKGAVRRPYGSTRSHGFKRGSLVKHPKWGLTYVGGVLNDRLSLHCVKTGKRLTQTAKPQDVTFLCYNVWPNKLIKGAA